MQNKASFCLILLLTIQLIKAIQQIETYDESIQEENGE